jgi:dsDNA-binding SOS-regulon protein
VDEYGLLEFNTAIDLYKKLKHDYEVLCKEENSNNYMNFILVADHLKDWIKEDSTFSSEKKVEALSLLKQSNYDVFTNMANRAKHFFCRNKQRIYTKDECMPSLDLSTADFSKWNFGEPIYSIEYDGKETALFPECEKIFATYKSIFE